LFNTLPQLRLLEIYETKQSGKLAQNNHKFMMKVQLDRRKTYLKITGVKNESSNDDERFSNFL
jgi:hypothetical protein